MAEKISDVVKNLLGGMHAISRTDTLIGEPTRLGGATVIPVHRLRVGFAAGAVDAGGRAGQGEGNTGARGVGGTAQLEPVAVLAIGPDGRPRLLAVDGDGEGTWQGLLRDAPDLLARVARKLAGRLEDLATPAARPALEAEPAPAPALDPKAAELSGKK